MTTPQKVAMTAAEAAAGMAVRGIRAVLVARGVPAPLVDKASTELLELIHARAAELAMVKVSAPGLVVEGDLPVVVRDVDG